MGVVGVWLLVDMVEWWVLVDVVDGVERIGFVEEVFVVVLCFLVGE